MNHLQSVAAGLLAQVDAAAKAAEAKEKAEPSIWNPIAFLQEHQDFGVFLLILLTAVLSFWLARVYAKSIRMADMGWRIGLILTCLLVSAEIIVFKWPPRLGVDLSGGVVYMAQISPIADDEDVKPEDLVPRLKERVDPTNTKEIMIRPYGSDMIEIVIPDVTDAEGDRIWNKLTQQGVMQFRIVGRKFDEARQATALKTLADAQAAEGNLSPWILDASEKRVGRWVGIGRKRDQFGELGAYRYVPRGDAMIRDGRTGVILDPPPEALVYEEGNEGVALTLWADSGEVVGLPPDQKADLEILMEVGNFDVTGDYLANPTQGFDDRNRAAVNFQLQGKGIGYFYKLTSDNLDRPLGIVMDDRLLSAPNINSAISSQGQIMGDFTPEEVKDLVDILKSGRLPATIKEQWVSKDQVDSNIGQQMQEQGLLAIGSSFIAVMIFMLIYYRFAGIVACFALIVNVAMIVALTMLISFPFSLTSLAGLVLTVGMSVDANVLIYERIREELKKGTALRMAMRNGFARATTTIVDANVTTLITAVVLYAIGTEQIRGFAVTLILGILISMFTAIFCARVIFEVAEKQRWIKKLSMMQLLHTGRIEFTRFWKVAIALSIVLILIGVVATAYRAGVKKDLLSYDLQGGTSARVVLTEAVEPDVVRGKLKDRFAGVGDYADLGAVSYGPVKSFEVDSSKVTAAGYDDMKVYRIDTGLKPWEVDEEQLTLLRNERKALIEQLAEASTDQRDELQTKLDAKNAEINEVTRRPDGYPEFTAILEEVFGDNLAHYELRVDQPTYEPTAGPRTPETGTPETGTPETGTPETGTPETGTPETGTPETGTPETGTPETGTPETGTPETGTPETGTPETGTPETGTPETGTPETGTPETGTPETGTPETGTPETGTPETGTPETGTPETGTPETGTPETGTPETGTPETGTPETGTPETGTPETGTPETGTPETGTPETGTPETGTPETGTPETGTPETGTPETGTPDSGEAGSDSGADESAGSGASETTDAGEQGNGNEGDGQSSLEWGRHREEWQFVSAPVQDDTAATLDDEPVTPPVSETDKRVNAETTLHFTYPIDVDGVRDAIEEVANRENLGINAESVQLLEQVLPEGAKGSDWKMSIQNTRATDVETLIDGLMVDFAEKPYFRSLADVGGQIAADAQVQAFAAILASLIGIVVYLWIRFQKVIFGFAAVVALVHDVLIVLGVIALSYWLNPALGFLLVDNFKISLPVIAAFLTIIGYSLNDTIVVFDRIREVKGKNPKLTQEMLDTSISQTLSRTILTSLTTLIVVGILYFLGGEAIHAFAFSLVIGVLVGTYSSIFIASPTLYWLAKRAQEA